MSGTGIRRRGIEGQVSMVRTWRQRVASILSGMLLGIIIPSLALGQATLLPNAKQTYYDDAGNPLASGNVTYYIPSTSTKKSIWLNSTKTTPSTNPVLLDGSGRPQPTGQTFGDGSYRQVVRDSNNIVIWDAVTSSTGGGSSGGSTAGVGDGLRVGSVIPWPGVVIPANYLLLYGQAVSRATYSDLFGVLTSTASVSCTSGNPTLSGVADTSQINVGAVVEATCVLPGVTVLSKTSTTITLSSNATASNVVTARFLNYGAGDGSTTFNLPDYRGVAAIGRNNMGGIPSSRMTSTYYLTNPDALGAVGGSQSHTMTSVELASHNHPVFLADPGHLHNFNQDSNGNFQPGGGGLVVQRVGSSASTPVLTASATTGMTVRDTNSVGGGGTANQTAMGGGGIAASATVAAVGSGYTNGTQTITVSGGTCSVQPQFTVTVSGNAFSGVPVLLTAGSCTVAPTNPVATTGGGGTGGTLAVTYSAVPHSVVQPSITANYIIKAVMDNPATISLNVLAASRLATTAALSTNTYSNGASGVGATLTANSNGALSVDSVVVGVNDRILVKDETDQTHNGIYVVSQIGSGGTPYILVRATDFDIAAEMVAGSYTAISLGTINVGSSWVLQNSIVTVGTDNIVFNKFFTPVPPLAVGVSSISGGTSNGVLYNGAGLLGNTAAGANNQPLIGNGASSPSFGNISALYTNYTPAGTGATVVNLQTRMRQTFNIFDYGAVCDGATDDKTAIQNTINAAGAAGLGGESSGIVYAPPGYICVSTAGLTINRPINVDFQSWLYTPSTSGELITVNSVAPAFGTTGFDLYFAGLYQSTGNSSGPGSVNAGGTTGIKLNTFVFSKLRIDHLQGFTRRGIWLDGSGSVYSPQIVLHSSIDLGQVVYNGQGLYASSIDAATSNVEGIRANIQNIYSNFDNIRLVAVATSSNTFNINAMDPNSGGTGLYSEGGWNTFNIGYLNSTMNLTALSLASTVNIGNDIATGAVVTNSGTNNCINIAGSDRPATLGACLTLDKIGVPVAAVSMNNKDLNFLKSALFSGTSSGAITVQPQAAAGTYNFNLPTTAGTSGDVSLSGGGGASPNTWITPGALTKTDDTNVTMVLGGTPASSLLRATSMTLGWAGTLSVARGGTGDSGTAWTAYTPTLGCGAGTLTTSNATGRYKQIGKTTFLEMSITITTNGTCATFVTATLPGGITVAANTFIGGKASAVSGKLVGGNISATGGTLAIGNYDNTYPGSNGEVLVISGAFEAQ